MQSIPYLKKEIRINTFLIGAQKAGTSSLYDWLSQHPDICAPIETKDYHYFHLNEINEDNQYPFDTYYKDFTDEKIILRGAVNYVFVSEATKRISEYNPEAKLILILRNPIKRAISAYNYFYKLGQEQKSWDDAIEKEMQGLLAGVIEKSNFSYLDHGYYYDQYVHILKYFDAANILVLFYEDMIDNKSVFFRSILKFLNVDINFSPDFNHVNKTGSAKYLWINRFFFGNSLLSRAIKPIVKSLTNQKWRILFGNWIRETNRSNGKSDNKMEYKIPTEVLDKYRLQRKQLGEICNRDLSKIWHF